jgi:alpha-tubulin suppressor-like RCC1 family protein
MSNGTLWAWGDNRQGQVDSQLNAEVVREEPWQITGLDEVPDDGWLEPGAGPGHSFGLTKAEQVFSWGSLGFTAPTLQRIPIRVKLPAGAGADFAWTGALAGADFSLGVDQAGSLYGWGGTGIANPSLAVAKVPRPLDESTNVPNPAWSSSGWTPELAVIGRTILAIGNDKQMKSWGDLEETDYQSPWWNPLRVADGIREFKGRWSRLAASRGLVGSTTNTNTTPTPGGFAAAVQTDGTLYTWGDNDAGQLGDGTTMPADEPKPLGRETNWVGVQAGARHVLAWKKDGSLWGWGVNSNGELGITTSTTTVSNLYSGGTNGSNQGTPRTYAGRVSTTTILLASNSHARPRLLLDRSWGFTNTNHSPVSAGGSHTLLLRGDGSLWSMGANESGQLGLGNVVRPSATSNVTTGNSSSTPSWVWTRTVSNLITNINVAPWRRETNIDTIIDEAWMYRPQRVGQKSWKSISAGERHSLAVRADGTLWAWGDNSSAQLGIGNLVSTNQPVQVGAANRWVRAFAGRDHSLGLQQDGSLWAWGKNDGRLGIDADAAEGSPFHELSFGQNLQGTLTLESAGRGTNRIFGTGLVRFQPRLSAVTMVFQLDSPGTVRTEWAGAGSYAAARHRLNFSTNLVVSPAGETSGGFFLRELKSGWFYPEVYQGTATVKGVNCRATLRFDGDADRDGIPDGMDATPAGLPPVFTNRIEIRIRVGEQTNVYETPGLGEGVTPILSSDLSDLPLGLSYTNGRIEGSPQREAVKIHDGFYEVVVGAANEGGESYQTLKIQVVPPDPMPALDKEIVSWTNGFDSFAHTIALKESGWKNYYQKYPVEFRGQNIPPGLILERDTGKLRPASPGATNVPNAGLYRMPYTITHRGGGVASGTLVVKSQRIWRVGRPLLYQVKLGGNGKTTISNLPPGLTYSAASGAIQGVPRSAGTFSTITAEQAGVDTNKESVEFVVESDPTVRLVAGSLQGIRVKRRGAGWSYPAIFSLGAAATQRVESSGQVRNLPASSAGSYALVWTNVDGWKWAEPAAGLASRLQESETLLRKNQRTEILRAFPGALRLARISYDSAVAAHYLPTNHAYWLRNAQGEPAVSDRNPGERLLDFSQPEWLRLLGERVKFLVQNGCIDGVYLPDWNEAALWPAGSQPAQGEAGESQVTARLELLRILRQAVGPQGWVMAEAAGDSWSLTGPMLDGIHLVAATESPTIWPPTANWWPDPYMLRESGGKLTLWERLANSLKAFAQEGVLRRPGVVALELWSRYDSRDPRTKTPRLTGLALSLCLSEGAYLYASPDWWQEKGRPLPQGTHVWYAEWGASLGLPMGEPSLAPDPRGVYQREFENGWAVYARPDQAKSVELEFPDAVKSWATGKSGREQSLSAGQGDIFLKK